MEKMKFETEELSQKNIEKIGKLFPNCITETKSENGELKKAINFEILKQMLSNDVVEDGEEHYEFTWVGKKEAMREANKPIRKTLRPCKEESKDWDNTENLYIEGDNLEALKLLQESYLNSIKMIYIDPPYNTGNDFIYNDDFKMTSDKYQEEIGQLDEDGNRLFKNTDTNGRFHSDWCSMIYSRLMLARNLLSDNGVIVISISDEEFDNMKKICNEIFGEKNFCGNVIWNSTKSVTNTALISVSHTYNLIYFKEVDYFKKNRNEFRLKDDGSGFENPDNDPRGPWKGDPFQVDGWRPNQQYEIINPNTQKVYKPNEGCSWKNDYNKFKELIVDNRIVFGKTGEGAPQRKRFIWEAKERGKVAKTIWDDVGTTTNGTQMLKKIFSKRLFDNPKPIDLIKRFLELGSSDDNDIILDFFSGSATTAHAVMDLNAEDGGNRKFIMVQLPEETDEKSAANKAGYKNICEIGKERIRRAGEKIKEENSNKEDIDNLDIGFRVLKIDSTNMKDVYYSPNEHTQETLFDSESNIKEDRDDLDLLFGCLIEWGIPLNRAYESKNIAGTTVHIYNEGDLIACFDDNISQEVIKEIAKLEPLRVVFKDSSFKTSAQKINVEEIFKLFSPETSLRVI